MAYINFKEENYKLKIQLEKRKKNNEKNYNYIIKHKNEMTDYSPDNRYSYEKINNSDNLFGSWFYFWNTLHNRNNAS